MHCGAEVLVLAKLSDMESSLSTNVWSCLAPPIRCFSPDWNEDSFLAHDTERRPALPVAVVGGRTSRGWGVLLILGASDAGLSVVRTLLVEWRLESLLPATLPLVLVLTLGKEKSGKPSSVVSVRADGVWVGSTEITERIGKTRSVSDGLIGPNEDRKVAEVFPLCTGGVGEGEEGSNCAVSGNDSVCQAKSLAWEWGTKGVASENERRWTGDSGWSLLEAAAGRVGLVPEAGGESADKIESISPMTYPSFRELY